jgi:hypothetical protein
MCTDAGATHCNPATNQCVQCLASSDCSGATPYCDTVLGAGPRENRCQQCLPANDTDAGVVGCDGGPGARCVATPPDQQFTCQ